MNGEVHFLYKDNKVIQNKVLKKRKNIRNQHKQLNEIGQNENNSNKQYEFFFLSLDVLPLSISYSILNVKDGTAKSQMFNRPKDQKTNIPT